MFLDANFLIYLNLNADERINKLFFNILDKPLYTDVLVLDEVLYISKKKYGIKYEDTLTFLEKIVLQNINILKLSEEEFRVAKKFLSILKPSDALHIASMINNGINEIVSEDKDFDKVSEIKRLWIE